jgi:hypothetical protein
MIRIVFQRTVYPLVAAFLLVLAGSNGVVHAQETSELITPPSTATPTPTPAASPEPTDSETPTATETPVPTPIPLPKIEFTPPLSLNQCQTLIDQVKKNLPTDPDGEPAKIPAVVPILDRMITTCSNFLEYRDDLHSSLAHYRWIEAGRVKVQVTSDDSEYRADHDEVKLDTPIRNVSAISLELEVEKSDVWIHSIQVYDDKDKLVGDFLDPSKPRLLRHSLPRREVYHFWQRTTIARIELECSKATRNIDITPRVVIYAGRTSRREYIKSAIYYLSEARKNLRSNKWAQTRLNLIRTQEMVNSRIKEER